VKHWGEPVIENSAEFRNEFRKEICHFEAKFNAWFDDRQCHIVYVQAVERHSIIN